MSSSGDDLEAGFLEAGYLEAARWG